MNESPHRPTARQRYLDMRQRRQTTAFAFIITIMAALSIAALLIVTGVISLPKTGFSVSVKMAHANDIVCPSNETRPIAPGKITVQISNATSQTGLALSLTNTLKKAGFKTKEPDNAQSELNGKVVIKASAGYVNEAYSVARLFPDSVVILRTGTDPVVNIILGTFFDGALAEKDVAKAMASQTYLEKPKSCFPVDPKDAEKSRRSSQSQKGSSHTQSKQSARSPQSAQVKQSA